jgi:sulfotransferase family protein
MIPYFIASLPRSRTAWLANFLTYGISYCFHEPMNKVVPKDYPDMLRGVGTTYCGISDCLNALIMDQLIDLFPEAKVVVIRRDISEVSKSLKRNGFFESEETSRRLLERINDQLDRITMSYDPLVIEFDDFDCARIWHYLFDGGFLFPTRRYQMLETFNITVPLEINRVKGMELLTKAGDFLLPLLA